MDDKSLNKFPKSALNYDAQVGDEVEIYGEGDDVIVSKLAVVKDAVAVPEAGKTVAETVTQVEKTEDSGSAGWGVLGFFFPLVGFILWLVWMKDKPKSSKSAGVGTLISVILGVLIWIIFAVVVGSVANSYSSY
ncbi:hypothetical protein FO433_06760 [Weissella cibaria]|nr:PLDc N-terminal domain-containing protein [Weissella cibaria]MCT0021668.1 hypothetical protein [Weissella cibaria]TVV26350.1 hypothetical protein FO433_06760 [Weissella cibaria]